MLKLSLIFSMKIHCTYNQSLVFGCCPDIRHNMATHVVMKHREKRDPDKDLGGTLA